MLREPDPTLGDAWVAFHVQGDAVLLPLDLRGRDAVHLAAELDGLSGFRNDVSGAGCYRRGCCLGKSEFWVKEFIG